MFYNTNIEELICKICNNSRGIFVYSFHEVCGIMEKNVEMERSICLRKLLEVFIIMM